MICVHAGQFEASALSCGIWESRHTYLPMKIESTAAVSNVNFVTETTLHVV